MLFRLGFLPQAKPISEEWDTKISEEPWIMIVCQGVPRKYDTFKQPSPFLHIWCNFDRHQFLKRKWEWHLVGWYYRQGSCINLAICPISPGITLVAHLGSWFFPWVLSNGILFLNFNDPHLSVNTVTMFLWAMVDGEYKIAESYEINMILMFLLPLYYICCSIKALPHSVHECLNLHYLPTSPFNNFLWVSGPRKWDQPKCIIWRTINILWKSHSSLR